MITYSCHRHGAVIPAAINTNDPLVQWFRCGACDRGDDWQPMLDAATIARVWALTPEPEPVAEPEPEPIVIPPPPPTRMRVYDYVKDHPRCTTLDVANAIERDISQAWRHLVKLRDRGAVTSTPQGFHGRLPLRWRTTRKEVAQ